MKTGFAFIDRLASPFKREDARPRVPTAEWLNVADNAAKFTADLWMVERHPVHRLFVVNDMMRRHVRHNVLIGAKFLCQGFTEGRFTFWKQQAKFNYPVPLKMEYPRYINSNMTFPVEVRRAQIKGELFLVPCETIIDLDFTMQNGVEFRRKNINVVV